VFPERDLTDRQQSDLCDIIQGCRHVLDDLNIILDKYRILDTATASLGSKSKKLWKRLKLEPEEIKELRSRISSNISLLIAFNGALTR
jgi:hypothetical protein